MFSIDINEVRHRAGNFERAEIELKKIRSDFVKIDPNTFLSNNNANAIQLRIEQIQSSLLREQQNVSVLCQVLTQIMVLYANADQDVASRYPHAFEYSAKEKNGHENLPKNSALFDDQGGYGGDQGDLEHNQRGVQFLWWRLFENEELYDFVRTREGYENYNNSQIDDLFKRINLEGCGYVAIVNSILLQYESNPDEFERVFGFSMFDESGEFNFDRLIIDFYCSTDNQYYLDEEQGLNALVYDVLNSYKDHPQDFVNRYGVNPFTDENHYNTEAMQAVLDEYQDLHVTTYDSSGTTVCSLENRVKHYLSQKSVYTSCSVYGSMTATEVAKELNKGKCVNLLTSNFNLYDSKGSIVSEDVGGHWMTVTDVTDDGNLVVSSWGKKFYIHQNELSSQSILVLDI